MKRAGPVPTIPRTLRRDPYAVPGDMQGVCQMGAKRLAGRGSGSKKGDVAAPWEGAG